MVTLRKFTKTPLIFHVVTHIALTVFKLKQINQIYVFYVTKVNSSIPSGECKINMMIFVHSIVDGDENLTLKINESLKHMQESVEKREENIKTLQLHAQTFEEDRQKVAENINSLMSKVKRNIKEEFDRIMKTLDECHKNTLQLLINKANEEKTKLEQIIADAKMQLQHLREAMTALQKYLFSLASATENFSPLSSTAELLKFLKETYYDAHRRQDNLKQLIVDYPMKKLSVASKWKTNINNWLQLRTKIMSNINEIPPLDDSDITVLAENRFVF